MICLMSMGNALRSSKLDPTQNSDFTARLCQFQYTLTRATRAVGSDAQGFVTAICKITGGVINFLAGAEGAGLRTLVDEVDVATIAVRFGGDAERDAFFRTVGPSATRTHNRQPAVTPVSGKTTWKVLPRPSALSAQSRPPLLVTISRAMNNPNPRPPA